MTTPAQFRLDIRNFVRKAEGNAELVLRKITLDMFSRVVLRSPVGNPDLWTRPAPPGYVGGRFRANWFASVGEPSNSSSRDIDPLGSVSLGRISAVASAAKLGETIFLVNNLPYAWPLETGWSSQAPAGMVGITVTEFQAAAARAGEGVASGNG
jgi:hypothetical protein